MGSSQLLTFLGNPWRLQSKYCRNLGSSFTRTRVEDLITRGKFKSPACSKSKEKMVGDIECNKKLKNMHEIFYVKEEGSVDK